MVATITADMVRRGAGTPCARSAPQLFTGNQDGIFAPVFSCCTRRSLHTTPTTSMPALPHTQTYNRACLHFRLRQHDDLDRLRPLVFSCCSSRSLHTTPNTSMPRISHTQT